jgi:hypothetical protein
LATEPRHLAGAFNELKGFRRSRFGRLSTISVDKFVFDHR